MCVLLELILHVFSLSQPLIRQSVFFLSAMAMRFYWFFDRPFSDDEKRNNAPQVVTYNDYQREVSISQVSMGSKSITFLRSIRLLFFNNLYAF